MNIASLFKDFPDDSHLWIYSFGKKLSANEQKIITNTFSPLLNDWLSHNVKTNGDFAIVYDFFLVLTNDYAELSGCAIDRCTELLKKLYHENNLNALKRDVFEYRNAQNQIAVAKRMDAKKLVENKTIDKNTFVFNNAILTLKELRENGWETKAINTWLSSMF